MAGQWLHNKHLSVYVYDVCIFPSLQLGPENCSGRGMGRIPVLHEDQPPSCLPPDREQEHGPGPPQGAHQELLWAPVTAGATWAHWGGDQGRRGASQAPAPNLSAMVGCCFLSPMVMFDYIHVLFIMSPYCINHLLTIWYESWPTWPICSWEAYPLKMEANGMEYIK